MLESAADHAAGGGMPGSTAEMTAGSKAERRRTTAADGDEKRRVRVRGSELAERAVGDAGVGAGDKETRDEGAFKARGEELDGSSGGKPVAGDSREVREGTVGLTRSGGQGSHARIGVSVRGEGSSHGDSWIGGASDKKMPLVVPFYHTGMADLMPARAMVPRVGKRVTVTVGDPVEVGDLLRKCACQGGSRPEVWAEIAKRLHRRVSHDRTGPAVLPPA